MGVWTGALLSYAMALAPGVSRLFILGFAAAGVGQLADEVFGLLHRVRTRGLGATEPVHRGQPEEAACPICGEAVSHEGEECSACGAPVAVGSEGPLEELVDVTGRSENGPMVAI